MTKKIFIGQAVTGQDMKVLNSEMEKVYDIFSQQGNKPYSTLEEEGKNNFKNSGDWVRHAFKIIEGIDVYVAIVRTEIKSEGMLMEIGYVLSKKKKFILAIKHDVKNSYLKDMANEIIEFKNFEDLLIKLKKLKI